MANPILNEKFVENERVIQGAPMTVNGTIQLTLFLTLLLVAAASFVWSKTAAGFTDLSAMLTGGGVLVGLVSALIISFTRNKYLVPIYAVAEGFALGGISYYFEMEFPGIVLQAVAGTFAALFSMLILYRMNIIRCTDKFRSVVLISTSSILVIYLVDFIGHFFGYAVPIINTSSMLGILFSLAVIVIAALNLIIDFDFIERASQAMIPKDFEWFGAFGLMVTLVWLYLEILKLIAKMSKK